MHHARNTGRGSFHGLPGGGIIDATDRDTNDRWPDKDPDNGHCCGPCSLCGDILETEDLDQLADPVGTVDCPDRGNGILFGGVTQSHASGGPD